MKKFLIGASTAAHQVEGHNIYSDYWAQEHMKHTSFEEPSLDATDHYNRYKEDIKYLVDAGLNAYRFSIEWARIEPKNGVFDEDEIQHYKEVLLYCHEKNITPIVTLHHFSSPLWLIQEGGWESELVVDYFKRYVKYVAIKLGDLMEYVCTINEANMGLQITLKVKSYLASKQADLQVGINLNTPSNTEISKENIKIFNTASPQVFLSPRTENGDKLIMEAHEEARCVLKEVCSHLKVGLTLSLHDFQAVEGGEKHAMEAWETEFLRYLPCMKDDDFFGLQNYTRKQYGPNGIVPLERYARKTQMQYEFYPQALGNVIRKVSQSISIPILITENGVATSDDKERIEFIHVALKDVFDCKEDGIEIIGYLHWSLLDNFEWQKGFSKEFGLIAVDRSTQQRYPKESLKVLGQYTKLG